MSPVRSQPSSVDRLGGLVGQVAVAAHHDVGPDRAPRRRSASLISTPGRRRADGADLDLVGRVDGAGAAGLAHAPQLGERQADRVEELEHLDRRRRGADVDRLDLVEAEHRAQPGEELLVGLGDRARRAPRAPARRAAPGAPSRSRRSSAAPGRLALLVAACAAIIVSRPALSFSQIRGTAKNHDGRTSGRYCETWRGSSQQVICSPKTIGR